MCDTHQWVIFVGYGYIDFIERESLVDALQMQEISMNNRDFNKFFTIHNGTLLDMNYCFAGTQNSKKNN